MLRHGGNSCGFFCIHPGVEKLRRGRKFWTIISLTD
jgi:hypothetical protein